MTRLKWSLLVLSGLLLLALIIPWAWLNYYRADLPDVGSQAIFLPTSATQIQTSICGVPATIIAVPAAEMSAFLPALFAAEGEQDYRGVLRRIYDDWTTDRVKKRYGYYSIQLARQLNCTFSGGPLARQLREIRIAIQLERRFTPDQLTTIYLNRVFIGPGINGIEAASTAYFGKHTSQLTVAESATVMGVIRSPNYYSPIQHPDRAALRRNEVIDLMLKQGAITNDQALEAKSEPLRTRGI